MKVSRRVYFLILIIEECAEIIHRTCKAIRFGLEERWKPEDGTNRELLEGELADLKAVLILNEREGNIKWTVNQVQAIDEKHRKVNRLLEYSYQACETIVPEKDQDNPPGCYQTWKQNNPNLTTPPE